MRRSFIVSSAAVLVFALAPVASQAGPLHLFGGGSSKAQPKAAAASAAADAVAVMVSQAMDEKRYVDAGGLLDKARIDGVNSVRLDRQRGDLFVATGRFSEAVAQLRPITTDPVEGPKALEGEGLALSSMGKSDEAFAALKSATSADKTLWRAWNGLGREYDLRHDWKQSKLAYAEALAAPGANTAIVLNNRGYSYLLQNDPDDAIPDLVAALGKDPALAAARTNLRIAIAVQGHYDRASVTGAGDDKAAVLNNVGLAAAVRGDYHVAEKLLQEAIDAKGSNYERAADNLELARNLEARAADQSHIVSPATP
jgi:Flp pilus assembly protein TadD